MLIGQGIDAHRFAPGRPLVLADPRFVKDPEMRAFFTFRRPMPDYWQGPSGPNQWSWLEVYPQHVFRNSEGEAEQMSVGRGARIST